MNEKKEQEYLSQNQLQVRNAEKIAKAINDDFGISTLPTVVMEDAKKLREIYSKLVENGGSEDFIFDMVDDYLKNAPIKANIRKKESIAQKRMRIKKECMLQWNVTIHDKNPSETIESDDNVRVRFVTWGNDLIGHYTTRVVFDTPIFVHEGALRNLRAVKFKKTSTRRGSNKLIYSEPMDRFTIAYNDVDEKFISDLKKKQDLAKSVGL